VRPKYRHPAMTEDDAQRVRWTFYEVVKNEKELRNYYAMAFRAPIKVCFGDIDNAGIVYYPRFMHYFHLAIEEFFSNVLGIDFADIIYLRNVTFPTVHVEGDFRRRLKYGDRVDMEVHVIEIGKSSITWGYRGYLVGDEEELVVDGRNTTVCVTPDTFEKIEVPEWLRTALTTYMNSCK